MITKVKARFSEGVLRPLERLDLEEGVDVVVSIEEIAPPGHVAEGLKASAGGWVGMHDPEELKRTIYEARRTGSRQEPDS